MNYGESRPTAKFLAVTAVVPAEHGCNLRCPGCVIDQLNAENVITLSHGDYLRFFAGAFSMPEVLNFSIQGHEALLPTSWPLSKDLLSMSVQEGKATSCVTNGTYLRKFAKEVMQVTHSIIVSVDSHDPFTHDRLRGLHGAWKLTIDGINAVRSEFGEGEGGTKAFGDYLAVASILRPNRTNHLLGMPELLASLGVRVWLITPLVSIKKRGYEDSNYGRIRDNMIMLDEHAKQFGVDVILSDELYHLENVEDLYARLTTDGLDKEEVIGRLGTDASYSVGQDILKATPTTFWNGEEDPVHFLRRIHSL